MLAARDVELDEGQEGRAGLHQLGREAHDVHQCLVPRHQPEVGVEADDAVIQGVQGFLQVVHGGAPGFPGLSWIVRAARITAPIPHEKKAVP